jgi:hypothetical protein
MTALLARWRRHWFEPAPLLDLAVARLVVVGILAWLDAGGRATATAAAAPQFWKPIPFLAAIGAASQPTMELVGRVASVETALFVLAAIGLAARPALAGIFVLQLMQEAWSTSLGKVTHATLPLLYVVAFLALSPCERVLSLRAWWRGRPPEPSTADARRPIELAVVVLAAYYCKAGIAKLHDGGLAWADGSTLQFYLMTNGRPAGMALATWPSLCAAASALVLAFELGWPLALVRRLRPAVLAAGALFHAATNVFLGISFWPVVATYLVCVPWTRLLARLGVPLDTPPRARH